MPEYTALGTIMAPGTTVAGYRKGDPVLASVVENWGLSVGEDGDVIEGPLPADEDLAPVVARPDEGANRASWEAYAVANGMSAEDAAVASQDDLEAVEPRSQTDSEEMPARPADSAKKSEWVDYVTSRMGDDEQGKLWARDDATTKANLQAWEPGKAQDPIALAATEADQAA